MRRKTPPKLKSLQAFKVRIYESRVLTCYLDARSRAGAVRETMKAWRAREIDPVRELPFEVSPAKIAQPVMAHPVAPLKQRGG